MEEEVNIDVLQDLYLKNPTETALGRSILKHSIVMIEEIGLEHFTFKKLAAQISSTEASIYRYFENKHLLLVYLSNWYWEYMMLNIRREVALANTPAEKLSAAIISILFSAERNVNIDYIDEDILHRIMISQADKVYRIQEVSSENKQGFFLAYKRVVICIGEIILQIDPAFPFARILASTLMEMPQQHLYYAKNLPSLTDLAYKDENSHHLKVVMENLAFSWLSAYHKAKTMG